MSHSHGMGKTKLNGLPWLNTPVLLHSSRADNCTLTPERCAYRGGYWRYWYQADYVYGRGTIYFLLVCTALFFIVPYLLSKVLLRNSSIVRKTRALYRYASTRSYRILGVSTPPLGVLLLGGVGVVFFFAMTLGPQPYYWPNTKTPPVNFGSSPPIATRTGWMALALLPFILVLSSKANLVTAVTGVSHEKLQVYHQWLSYACFVLALIHTFPFIVFRIWRGDMMSVWENDVYYWTGVAALIPQAWLTFASITPIRRLSYEFFKAMHFVSGILFVFFFFIHCNFRLTSWDYFIVAGCLYGATFLYSRYRIYMVYGTSFKAHLNIVSGNYLKVSILMHPAVVVKNAVPEAPYWKPGQHMFISFLIPNLNALSAHPFSICSLPELDNENVIPEMVFYIKPTKGFTGRLAKMAETQPNRSVRVLLEGPYGGVQRSFATFEQVIVVTGGVGAGFSLPVIQDILRRATRKTVALQVVLATRSRDVLTWYREEISRIIAESGVTDVSLSVSMSYTGSDVTNLTVTDEEFSLGSGSESEDVKGQPKETYADKDGKFSTSIGRPDLPHVIGAATTTAGAQDQSIGVCVCGPDSMLLDVRNAVAAAQTRILRTSGTGEVYLHSENFDW